MDKHEQMSRRSFLLKMLGLVGVGLAGSGYVLGERFWVEVTKVKLSVAELPEVFRGWRIAQFSDLHLGFHYSASQLSGLVGRINRSSPDIVFFTGDLLDRAWAKQPDDKLLPILKQLDTPRGGKWAVLGNHDYAVREEAIAMLQEAGFRVLINGHGYIEEQGQRLCIAGVDEYMFGKYDLQATMRGIGSSDCVLMLAHEPDLADSISNQRVHAQFSGHSHGGQIRGPFMKPFFTPELGQKYVQGLYAIGNKPMQLYVNRGIGTSFKPVRLFCRPELTLFELS